MMEDNTSANNIKTKDGGIICPSVPEVQIVPEATLAG